MLKFSGMNAQLPFQELPEAILVLLAKGLGAVLGSAVSIAYVLPKGRREAAIRFLVGFVLGISFGPTCGLKIALYFGIETQLSKVEIAMMGATAASLCAWWALGVVRNFLDSRAKALQSTK